MKVFLWAIFCVVAVSAIPAPLQQAEACIPDICKSDDGCYCSSKTSPLSLEDTPQLISLTFDEAVEDKVVANLWEKLFFERSNPDGNPVSGTFFVPHEYTDYRRVQELYLRGFEIGVNSITKNSLSTYWKTASVDTLTQEFQGQRIIVSNFANIPIEDLKGARTPQLELEGDVSINAYNASGIEYDSSWTSRSTSMFYPYTLDYLSTQKCRSGTICPTESHPKFWILPINNIQGNGSVECNSLTTCNFQGNADEIGNWLLTQVDRVRNSNKAPMTLMVNSAWFHIIENSYEGFVNFLDGLTSRKDVFLVSQKQVIDWIKNPVPLKDFKTEVPKRNATCAQINCVLTNANLEIRYMMSCVPCPQVYPWLGNPMGVINTTKSTN